VGKEREGKREGKGRGHGHGSERGARCGAVRARGLRRVGDFGRVGLRFFAAVIADATGALLKKWKTRPGADVAKDQRSGPCRVLTNLNY
jgi:hypothetical protein